MAAANSGVGPLRDPEDNAPVDTLLYKTGLAESQAISWLAQITQATCTKIPPNLRTRAIGRMIQHAFTRLHIPTPTLKKESGMVGGQSGRFDRIQWDLSLDGDLFDEVDAGDLKALKKLAKTIVHEARHAEQIFNAARRQAALGKSAAEIASLMNLPNDIATAAVADPLPDGPDVDAADRIYDAAYGAGAKLAQEVMADLREAAMQLRRFVESKPMIHGHGDVPEVVREATEARLAELNNAFETARAANRALPLESDAYAVENLFVKALTAIGDCNVTQ